MWPRRVPCPDETGCEPMGFYSIAVLIADAERHGATVLPPEINQSGYDHGMKRTESGAWAVRLGLRVIAGIGEKHREEIERAQATGTYENVHEACRRLTLPRDALTHLAAVGAFASLGLTRREAMWAVGAIDAPSDLLPDAPLVIPALPPLTDEEAVRLDLALMGCAPGGRHLMRFHREQMERWRVVTAAALDAVPHGATVRVGGVVMVRQRPGTSKGVVFLTLEDETGVVNVVVMPNLFTRQRQTIRTAGMLAVEGVVERVDGVTHVRVTRVKAFGRGDEADSLLSKHFT